MSQAIEDSADNLANHVCMHIPDGWEIQLCMESCAAFWRSFPSNVELGI